MADNGRQEITKLPGTDGEEPVGGMEPAPKKPRGRPPKSVSDDPKVTKDGLQENREWQDNAEMQKQLRLKDDQIKHLRNAFTHLENKLTDTSDELKATNEELVELRSDNDRKDNEIKELQRRLEQKELEYEELLEQIDDLVIPGDSASSTPSASRKKKFLIVVDRYTRVLVPHLADRFHWVMSDVPTKSIPSEVESISEFDAVFFMTGTSQLCEGASWTDIQRELELAFSRVEDLGVPAINICLPPADKKALTGKVSILNHKLSKTPHAIKTSISSMCKTNFLDTDGVTLTQKGIKLFADLVNRGIEELNIESITTNMSERISTPISLPTSFKESQSVDCVVEIKRENIGKLIGKGGHTIKGLGDDHGVSLEVGQWHTKGKGSDEHKFVFDGVIIRGEIGNVLKAKKCVNNIMK